MIEIGENLKSLLSQMISAIMVVTVIYLIYKSRTKK